METDVPIRAAVFDTVAKAEAAVGNLLKAGFAKDEITVICTDETKERSFHDFERQKSAGTYTPVAAVAGGVIGAALGGFAVMAAGVATGGIGLVAAGGLAAWAGGAVGGLVGAMLTRGVEKELANFYDQAVTDGKILVAVDVHGQSRVASARIAQAERILEESGALPEPLPEG